MSGDEWRTLKVEHGVQEAHINPLLSGSLYEFMVSSRDPHGEGLMSKTIRIHTKGLDLQNSKLQSLLKLKTGEKFEVVETVETVQEVQAQPDVEHSGTFQQNLCCKLAEICLSKQLVTLDCQT